MLTTCTEILLFILFSLLCTGMSTDCTKLATIICTIFIACIANPVSTVTTRQLSLIPHIMPVCVNAAVILKLLLHIHMYANVCLTQLFCHGLSNNGIHTIAIAFVFAVSVSKCLY